MRALVAGRGGLFFDRRRDRGVVLFLMRVRVYVGVGVCIRTHAHTLHTWGTRL